MSIFDRTLIIGKGDANLARPNKLHNVEEWKATMQAHCETWTVKDIYVEIHILKLYSQCTMHISGIFGDTVAVAGTPDKIRIIANNTAAGPLPSGAPAFADKIPERFLPRICSISTTNEDFVGSYLVSSIHNSVGYPSLMTIPHYPVGHVNESSNGEIEFGQNASNANFSSSDASIQPTDLVYIANSNINI